MADSNNQSDTDAPSAETDASQRESGWDGDEQASLAVVESVSARTDCDPADLPPLHDYIDPDALDALVTTGAVDSRSAVRVSFSYDEMEVTVDSREGVEIRPTTGDG